MKYVADEVCQARTDAIKSGISELSDKIDRMDGKIDVLRENHIEHVNQEIIKLNGRISEVKSRSTRELAVFGTIISGIVAIISFMAYKVI